MRLVIREARPVEHAALGELTVAGYRSFYGAELGPYAAPLRDVDARAAGGVVLVAELDGELVGTVTYVPDATSPLAETQREGEASFRMLAVAPDRQGNGIGRALTVACVERARAEGKRALGLHADEVMHVSRGLYERLGFVRDPARDFRAEDETLLLGYVLDLAR